MKPIRSKKFLLTLMLLTAGCATAFSVSAEDNGYWTMREDSTGLPVMVYTYTEPVEFVISNTGTNDPAPAEPVQAEEDDAVLSTSEEAPVRLAGSPLAIPAESAAENTENTGTPLLVLTVGGTLFLAGLAYALYRAL